MSGLSFFPNRSVPASRPVFSTALRRPVFSTALRRRAVLLLPFLWFGVFLVAPFLIVLKISLAEAIIAQPPYSLLLEWQEGPAVAIRLTFRNYAFLLSDPLYLLAWLGALRIAATATAITLLLGYPMAYAIVRAPRRWRGGLLLAVILPFWTSFLIRVYAWMSLLRPNGLINGLLLDSGLIGEPLPLLNTEFAVYLGIVYSYLPFMILPLYATLEKLDPSLLEAAADLGCRPWRAFWRITVPLSRAGIVAGCLLVLIPAMGEVVIPELLGGPDTLMIGKVLWNEFFANRDWPVAAAVAVALLLLLVPPLVLLMRVQEKATARAGAAGAARRGLHDR